MPPAPEEPDSPDAPDDPDNPDSPDTPVDPPCAPVPLAYIVAANPAFNEGCTYELTLTEGWVFVGEDGADKPETIRTAAFSIAMAEVHNLRMNENVKFLQDTNDPGNGDRAFQISRDQGARGLCKGGNRRRRHRDLQTAGRGGSAVALRDPRQLPLPGGPLPAEGGAVSMDALDAELYAIIADQAGRENEDPGSLVALAKSRLNAGDFVTFHTGTGAAGGVCYGSVTAVFSFAGIQRDNVTVTTGRGMTPSTAAAEAGRQLGLEHLSIVNISPAIGPIDNATGYTVECLNLPGARADVTFDINQGDAPMDPADKLVGSLLTNLPQPARYGCTFAGWANQSGTVVRSIVVPEGGTTLTAQWTPNTYTLTLIGNGGNVNGQSSAAQTITFDAPYRQLPAASRTGYRFDGWWTEPDGGDPVTADTVLRNAENTTVYAHWKDLLRLQDNDGSGSLFDVTMRTETYDRNTTYTRDNLTYSQKAGLADAEGNPIPTDGFFFELKPKIASGVSDGTAHDAGTYILEITRNADEVYESYTETHDILVINKADWLTVFGAGVFNANCSGKINAHNSTIGEVTVCVSLTTSDLDPEQSVMNAMRFKVYGYRLTNEGGSADLGQTLKIHSSQKHASGDKWREITVTVEFPSGAASKDYNLPASVQVYSGKVDAKV